MCTSPRIGRLLGGGLLALALQVSGCAAPGGPEGYDYFARPDRRDPWSLQILRWQVRARADVAAEPPRPAPLPAADPDDLGSSYRSFVAERKRALVLEVAHWAQNQGARHYVADDGIDYWPTLREILARNGDDCDGLELLTYYLLRDLGFRDVYRAIVWRPSDDQHHMVTLWFEQPGDPRVIDPTGAMTLGAPRMSEVRGWVPLKVFDESREYTVRRHSSR